MEESIYSLLPTQQEVPARPPRHHSKVCIYPPDGATEEGVVD